MVRWPPAQHPAVQVDALNPATTTRTKCIPWGYTPFPLLLERCPPRQRSRVGRLKAKVEPLLTEVTVENEVLRLRSLSSSCSLCLSLSLVLFRSLSLSLSLSLSCSFSHTHAHTAALSERSHRTSIHDEYDVMLFWPRFWSTLEGIDEF